jgi:transposase
MQASLEQRYAIKFCVKMGNSASETLEMLRKAYGQATLSSAQVYRWHKAFKDGRESVEDEQRAGRVSSSKTQRNVDAVMSVLNRDRWFTVRMITEELGLAKTVVHEIVTRIDDEKSLCKTCSQEFVIRAEGTPSVCLSRFVGSFGD